MEAMRRTGDRNREERRNERRERDQKCVFASAVIEGKKEDGNQPEKQKQQQQQTTGTQDAGKDTHNLLILKCLCAIVLPLQPVACRQSCCRLRSHGCLSLLVRLVVCLTNDKISGEAGLRLLLLLLSRG